MNIKHWKLIIKFIYGIIAFVLTSGILFKIPVLSATSTFAWIYPSDSFPGELKSIILLIFRLGMGILFVLHGYPKLTHLKQWSKSLNNMPIPLCFIGAATMFFGGFCLIAGFLTPLAAFGILASMGFALFLHIKGGKPFVAQDPYLNPPDYYKGPKGKAEAPSQEKAMQRVVGVPPIVATASRSIFLCYFHAGNYRIWTRTIFSRCHIVA